MGIHDSSRSRVAPFFGRLHCIDPSGRSWLQPLLDLANTRNVPQPEAGTSSLEVAKWWPREVRLPAPGDLLEWLVRNVATPEHPSAWGRRAIELKRRRLVDRDPMTLEEALGGLRMSRSGRAWYVLEGPSQPDVYLATGEVIVIIEAKRTETGPTTSTKWMRVRHQMLRHLDAAWDIRGERRVYGLFVVEAEGETDVAPEAWRQAVDETVSPAMLERSLPHRSEEVRSAIAGAVLGLVTWQTLCSRLGVPHEVLIPEVMDLRGAPRPARRRSGGVPRPPATPVDSA